MTINDLYKYIYIYIYIYQGLLNTGHAQQKFGSQNWPLRLQIFIPLISFNYFDVM